jgi:hypothetical protein
MDICTIDRSGRINPLIPLDKQIHPNVYFSRLHTEIESGKSILNKKIPDMDILKRVIKHMKPIICSMFKSKALITTPFNSIVTIDANGRFSVSTIWIEKALGESGILLHNLLFEIYEIMDNTYSLPRKETCDLIYNIFTTILVSCYSSLGYSDLIEMILTSPNTVWHDELTGESVVNIT